MKATICACCKQKVVRRDPRKRLVTFWFFGVLDRKEQRDLIVYTDKLGKEYVMAEIEMPDVDGYPVYNRARLHLDGHDEVFVTQSHEANAAQKQWFAELFGPTSV